VRTPLRCVALLLAWSVLGLTIAASSFAATAPATPTPTCSTGKGAATATTVGRLTTRLAWRAKLLERAETYSKLAQTGTPRHGFPTRASPSWLLALTARSNVLHQFDGGNGRIGIHGRGGTSLLDPPGTNRSHGCVRLANAAIDWLVHTVGISPLPGTPVQIH
jgi:hypothetical protein